MKLTQTFREKPALDREPAIRTSCPVSATWIVTLFTLFILLLSAGAPLAQLPGGVIVDDSDGGGVVPSLRWGSLGDGTDAEVNAIAQLGGELFAAGAFQTAGGVTANRVARWNGDEWNAVGQGMDDTVSALITWGNDLIAGGRFTLVGSRWMFRVARWRNSSWDPIGTGVDNGEVLALCVYDDGLVAAGSFSSAGGAAASNIARWDGSSWSPLGTGIDGEVRALAVYNNELIAAGSFSMAGGTPCANIARWNGTFWSPLSLGTDLPVNALALKGGDLFAGGEFSVAGGVAASHLARWNSDTEAWSALGAGVSGPVHSLGTFNEYMVIGGLFTRPGSLPTNNIAFWNNGIWGGLFHEPNDRINALLEWRDGLMAAGRFTEAGSEPANYIARWPCDPPPPPTGLFASTDLCGRIEIHWNTRSRCAGYRLYRDGGEIADLPQDVSSYNDTSAPSGTHTYTITTLSRCGESDPSAPVTGGAKGAPAVPAGITASDTSCSVVRITWGASYNADSYRLLRDGAQVGIFSSGVNQFEDTPSPGEYQYSVSAGNNCGWSSPVSAVGRVTPVPSAPSGVTASDTSYSFVRVDWNASDWADGYRVYRDGTLLATPSAATLFYEAPGAPGYYSFGVSAGNDCGWSDPAGASGVIQPVSPPAPDLFTASDTSCSFVRLDWMAVMGSSGYRLYRGDDLIASLPISTTHYIDWVPPGVYSYSLSAGNSTGWSPSVVAMGSVLSPPETPGGFNASADLCSWVSLQWTESARADSYLVYRDEMRVAALPRPALSYSDPAGPGEYAYTLVAKNKCGSSSPASANGVVFPADPGLPVALEASDTSCALVHVEWIPPTGADSCLVYRDGEIIARLGVEEPYFDDPLPPGEYEYGVAAGNRCGYSGHVLVIGHVLPAAPQSPLLFTASDSICGAVYLEWNVSDGAETYYIYRDGSPLDTVEAAVLSHEDFPEPGGHEYGLAAGNRCGVSPIATSIGRALAGPDVPGVMTASDTSCVEVYLEWSVSADADSYRVSRDGEGIAVLPASVSSFGDQPGPGVYGYGISAGNECGWSKLATASGKVISGTPAAPGGLTVAPARCDSVLIAWEDLSEDETGFQIVRDGEPIADLEANATGYADSPEPGSYEYEVIAIGRCGDSPGVTVTGIRLSPPAAPLLVGPPDGEVFEGFVDITLQWNSTAEMTGYHVQLWLDEGSTGAFLDTILDGDVSTLLLPSIPPPGVYRWHAASLAECGSSPFSESRRFARNPEEAFAITNRNVEFEHDPLGGPAGSDPPDPDPDLVVIRNEGETSFSWSVEPGHEWIDAEPVSGMLTASEEETIWVNVSPELLMTGDFTGYLLLETDLPAHPRDTIRVDLSVTQYPVGDCNGDGNLDERDVAALADHRIDILPLWAPIIRIGLADIDFDGTVDGNDMSLLPGLIAQSVLASSGSGFPDGADEAGIVVGVSADTFRVSLEGTGEVRAGLILFRQEDHSKPVVRISPPGSLYETVLIQAGRNFALVFYTLEETTPSLDGETRIDLATISWEGAGREDLGFSSGGIASSGINRFPVTGLRFLDEESPGIRSFAFFPIRPNPFASECLVSFEIPETMPVSLHVFNVNGRLVRTLVSGDYPPGFHSVTWDGRDDDGRSVSHGVYFIKLDSPRGTKSQRGVIIR